jgi:hypothetical protein
MTSQSELLVKASYEDGVNVTNNPNPFLKANLLKSIECVSHIIFPEEKPEIF